MVAVEEVLLIEKTVKADPRFQEALRRRGLLDELEYMCIDPWTVGDFGFEIEKGRRLLNCFVWMRTFPLDNFYAHPVEGLHAMIDLSTFEVIKVDDHFAENGDYIPVPRTPLNFDSASADGVPPAIGAARCGAAGRRRVPRRQGNEVSWENWDFRVGFNGREGLVLYTIGYTQTMACAARFCIAPRSPRWWCRTARRSAAITARTCSTAARSALAAWRIRSRSAATAWASSITSMRWCRTCSAARARSRTAVCLHEEDAGLAWKHFDVRSDRTEVRRARQAGDLVDLDDRQLRICVLLVSASGWAHRVRDEGDRDHQHRGLPSGPARASLAPRSPPGIVGHIHQHVFCARLDMEVDGPDNTVRRVRHRGAAAGTGQSVRQCLLCQGAAADDRTRGAARRRLRQDALLEDHQPAEEELGWQADRLQAGGRARRCSRSPIPTARPGERGRFIQHQLWVTPFDPANASRPASSSTSRDGDDGLAAWTAGGPVDREHGHRAVAQFRPAPSAAAGGSSGAALRGLRLQADAVGVLRPEPGDRPAAGQKHEKLPREKLRRTPATLRS